MTNFNDNQKIADLYTKEDKNDDAIKDLNILCKYEKIAIIRDKQFDERKGMENLYKQKGQSMLCEYSSLSDIKSL